MKWTLVTGGAKRLGAEICRTLAGQGHHLVIHYNKSKQEAIEVADACKEMGVHAEYLHGDFSTGDSTQAFLNAYLAKFESTENLINNVGNYRIDSALNTPAEDWYSLFQTNLHAPFKLIQGLSPSLAINKGSIINLGVAGIEAVRADTYHTVYGLTKLSLWMLTKSLAKELAPSLVRVNMVSPGYLDNSSDLMNNGSSLPMKRACTLREVADVIAFLLKQDNNYITGQNIEVSGGVRL